MNINVINVSVIFVKILIVIVPVVMVPLNAVLILAVSYLNVVILCQERKRKKKMNERKSCDMFTCRHMGKCLYEIEGCNSNLRYCVAPDCGQCVHIKRCKKAKIKENKGAGKPVIPSRP